MAKILAIKEGINIYGIRISNLGRFPYGKPFNYLAFNYNDYCGTGIFKFIDKIKKMICKENDIEMNKI